jgi:hypothetical protein
MSRVTAVPGRLRRTVWHRAGWALWCLWLMVLVAPSVQRAQTILREEVRFQAFDNVNLATAEPCPPWLRVVDSDASCRLFTVGYRGVFLSGFLVEHAARAATLAIYHTGHEAETQSAANLRDATDAIVRPDAAYFIGQLFDRGANVLVLFMPGLGLSPREDDAPSRRMHAMTANHNVFALLDFPQDSAAAFFVAHVKAFLDRHGRGYRQVHMYGRSGGAWSTTMAAALDRRIHCSVAFFGTLPMRLRMPLDSEPADSLADLGDFEQFGLYLFKRLDYLDLYALATTPNRRHVQVYNEQDNCCFPGETKGSLVGAMFRASYPTIRNFSTVILPRRSAADHFNLDAVAFGAAIQACPIGTATEAD